MRDPPTIRFLGLLAILLVLAVGAEVALRIHQRMTRGVPLFALLPDRHGIDQFPFSPFLVFGPRVDDSLPDRRFPALARFNAQGFRLPVPVAPDPGRTRVIALGGSTTMDVWNDLGVHWPAVAECRLRTDRPDLDVWNAGMSAYATPHTMIRLALDVIEYDPAIVVVMHAINDLSTTYLASALGLPVDPHYLVKFGLPAYTQEVTEKEVVVSRLLWSIRARFDRDRFRAGAVGDYELTEAVRLFVRNLQSIHGVAAAHGVVLVLLTQPFDPQFVPEVANAADTRRPGVLVPADSARFAADMRAFNEAIRQFGRDHPDVHIIDMAALLPPGEGRFVDVVHYSAVGSLQFGSTLASALRPLLPPPPHHPSAAATDCAWLPEAERLAPSSRRPARW